MAVASAAMTATASAACGGPLLRFGVAGNCCWWLLAGAFVASAVAGVTAGQRGSVAVEAAWRATAWRVTAWLVTT